MFLGMAVWMQWSKKEMCSSGKIWKDNSLGNFGKDFYYFKAFLINLKSLKL